MRSVVIVGQGPGAYMCGIYLHTANMSPLIIKACKEKPDFSGSGNVVGVKGIQRPEEFIDLVERQSRNMGINVVEEEVVEIARREGCLEVKTDASVYKTKSLVIDSKALETRYRPLLEDNGVFYVSDKAPCKEAIVLAGAGCKVSFDVKEFMDTMKQ
ncbi:THIOREDOXIN REDUCTASE [Encephalitozoon cuniculi GB-M1]|uniref:THIOREDOXIN REDUCTASE n=1 Tax=Encephalitozoon cuniculi (strain GB-M1) TaxID=284813 RepID=Q8SSL6_ENCCU|nr:thioredoxin reductase [Encephalitozoon cuniculi GB-M1]CAD24938.1 THIOREDOXIN REDUCTASE [Encephalitozoon cuniculi GB-M1]